MAAEGAGQALGPITVFLADNHREFCTLVTEYLSREPGLTVVGQAHDGVSAIRALAHRPSHVLLLDLVMPHLDGIGVLEHLQQWPAAKRPRVVVITALGSDPVVQRLAALGADAYLLKPFRLKVLAERIRWVMGLRLPVEPPGREPPLEPPLSHLLHELGIPPHLSGYIYIREAILMVIAQGGLVHSLGREVYRRIAVKHGVTVDQVQASIRYALSISGERADAGLRTELFGSRTPAAGFPSTPSEFIYRLAYHLRAQLLEGHPGHP